MVIIKKITLKEYKNDRYCSYLLDLHIFLKWIKVEIIALKFFQITV